jgi:S-DNA-T family DNA segregation ATPase FtsK/SpoIIIE
MRTDLTIRTGDGVDHDVAVIAPSGTTLARARAAMEAAVRNPVPGWAGGRRLDDTAVFGRPPLVHGAVLACFPAPADRPAATGLDLVGGPDAGTGLVLTRRDVTAGRAPDCDLVLTDPQVSRHHALFAPAPGGLLVHDLGSTNGTTIDATAAAAPAVVVSGALVRVGDSFVALAASPGEPAATRPSPAGGLLVARSPRPVREPAARVVLAAEPARSGPAPHLHVAATVLPAAIGGALAWLTGSWQFLAFAALSPVIGLSTALGARRRQRRHDRRSAADRRQVEARAEAEIADLARRETARRRRELPDPATLLRVARIPTTFLWQRARDDADLLTVRVGLATQPSQFVVERDGVRSPARMLPDVPAALDLARGAVAVVAPRLVRERLARWLVAQLAVAASPADLEIEVLVAHDDRAWQWARWLPHVLRRVRTGEVVSVEGVVALVRERQAMPSGTWSGPRLVLVTDAVDAAGFVVAPDVGVSAVVLAERESDLPAWCTQLVRASDETGTRVVIRSAGGRLDDVVADQVSEPWAQALARALAPLRDELHSAPGDDPDGCRLIELAGMPARSADALRARWRNSGGSASCQIGLGRDGVITVDLDRDGPHALIAGSTGSGKSELLQTLVAGLAVENPPSELTFLLVDYKGGAAFADCARLPHTIGLVTDLDEQLTRRVLASLDSEVRRREAILAEARARDLAEHRAHDRAGTPARLVIVVDEFAVLAEELPDFLPGLVGIARRGRSLGLHLVLATQRPAGVVSPEIRANTALRICLRVTSAAESLDVIDGPEASTIARNTPGRAFLRSGHTTTAVQVARVAGPAAAEPDAIRVLPLDAWRCPPPPPTRSADTDLRRIVALAADAARGLPEPHRPWLPPLPYPLPLASLPTGATAHAVPIGLVDQPDQQRQAPLVLDLAAGEVVAVAGRTRSGRSTTLLTVAVAAAQRRSPQELHVYGIDATGDGLAQLRELPHTGTVVTVEDGFDLAVGLVERLTEVCSRRRGRTAADPAAVLVLLDGWDQFVAAAEDHDGGRAAESFLDLLRSAPGAAVTVVLTGGRPVLAPRVLAHATTRLVLALADAGEYAVAGVDSRAVPRAGEPGRGVRAGEGVVFQIAVAPKPEAGSTRAGTPAGSLRLRALPRRVNLADLPRRRGLVTLGVGGDAAAPLTVDPCAGSGRMLVAGPPRSGRTTLLRAVTEQVRSAGLVVAAPVRSPLVAHSRRVGARILAPTDHDPDLPPTGLLVVDDAEAFADTPVGEALAEWVRADAAGRAAVVAGRSDALAVTFRGLAAEVRHARCGVLLQPGPVDAELFGIVVPRRRAVPLPGRGLLVPDPSWGLGTDPLPLQVAAA